MPPVYYGQQYLQCNPDRGKGCAIPPPWYSTENGHLHFWQAVLTAEEATTDTLCQERTPFILVAIKEVVGVALVSSVVEYDVGACFGCCD